MLREFSRRRIEIEERARELTGVAASKLSRDRLQGIALATRKAKEYGVDGARWKQEARARAAEHGLGYRELARLTASERLNAEGYRPLRKVEHFKGRMVWSILRRRSHVATSRAERWRGVLQQGEWLVGELAAKLGIPRSTLESKIRSLKINKNRFKP